MDIPLPASPKGYAALVRHSFKIQVPDTFSPKNSVVTKVRANGISQLILHRGKGRTVIGTYAMRLNGNYHPTHMTSLSYDGNYRKACSGKMENGLLIPFNPLSYNKNSNRFKDGIAGFAALYEYVPYAGPSHEHRPDITDPQIFEYQGYTKKSQKALLKTKWDFPSGSFGDLLHYGFAPVDRYGNPLTIRAYKDNSYCSVFAWVDKENLRFVRQVVSGLKLNTFETADPATPPEYKDSNLEFRVVYKVGQQGAGAGKIEIDFEGPCCDSFRDEGKEVCE